MKLISKKVNTLIISKLLIVITKIKSYFLVFQIKIRLKIRFNQYFHYQNLKLINF